MCQRFAVILQVTEEMMDQANNKKMEAIDAQGEGSSIFCRRTGKRWVANKDVCCSVSLLQVSCRKLWIFLLRPSSWTPVSLFFMLRGRGENPVRLVFYFPLLTGNQSILCIQCLHPAAETKCSHQRLRQSHPNQPRLCTALQVERQSSQVVLHLLKLPSLFKKGWSRLTWRGVFIDPEK